jgi:cytochrome c
MSTHKTVLLCATIALGIGAASAAEMPKFGKPISNDDLKAWDISIAPDGVGLPAGSGTAAQGATVFAAKCAACHGAKGEGGQGPQLVGGIGSLPAPNPNPIRTVGSYWPYATTVFDYIRRAMPITNPQSLQNDEVYAVTAYVLSIDNIVPKDAVLDAGSLPKVQMPNRAGFVNWEPRLLKP